MIVRVCIDRLKPSEKSAVFFVLSSGHFFSDFFLNLKTKNKIINNEGV